MNRLKIDVTARSKELLCDGRMPPAATWWSGFKLLMALNKF
jgi:hypothetical protein